MCIQQKKDGGLLPFKVNSTSIQEAIVIGVGNAKSKGTVKHNITLDVTNK